MACVEETVASDGSIYFAGITQGDLAPGGGGGFRDAFIGKYQPDGSQSWVIEFGTSSTEYVEGISELPNGNIVIVRSPYENWVCLRKSKI